MNKMTSLMRYSVALAATFLCLSADQGFAAVTATPESAIFTSPQQSATIQLKSNGVPISAADIRGWQLLASGHDYQHMILVDKVDGAITITPSKTVEVGSYDLKIETTQGSVVVRVLTPLSNVPDIIEKTAALTGESERKIQTKLGLTTPSGREHVQIDLPSVYYEGQTLKLTMVPQPEPGHSYAWYMNGDVVSEGTDRNALHYTFKQAGDYVLTYIETTQTNGAAATVSRAQASTRVVPVPGVNTPVNVGTIVTFEAPIGYRSFVWKIDGNQVSTDSTMKYTFDTPANHAVECLATSPSDGLAEEFMRARYNVTVSPK